MKAKIITFTLTVFILCSCRTKSARLFEKNIVGEWTFIKIEDNRKIEKNDELLPPPPLRGNYKSGYIFWGDGVCENKLGYFRRTEDDKSKDKKLYYLGNKTKYKIEDESLKIFDLSKNSWKSKKIFSLGADTLILQESDSVFVKYSKTKYKLNPRETYDKIIVSSTGCYGTCPIMDISIDKNGDILYWGQEYNTQNGFFSSSVKKEVFEEIERAFKKSKIHSLKSDYSANWTDAETVSITFIKDNKIIKTISDYGAQSPTELYWAYMPVRFLYQQVKLVPYLSNEPEFLFSQARFSDSNQVCDLTKSESFFLLTEILKSEKVSKRFENKYRIEFWGNEDKKEIIYTDGRFYKFTSKAESRVIDLGYNFLTENNLMDRFRERNEYHGK